MSLSPRHKSHNKSDQALLTISELARELGVGSHILRYWESHFPDLRPLQRAGNRRYYRPDDVALARRINHLLNSEGYTVKGAVKYLSSEGQKDNKNASEAEESLIKPEICQQWQTELRLISNMLSEALTTE
ncbi:MAG: MerR family transcriptional regulator [Zymomonas sp.]|nr:MerR family transcriptional regulator [Zymomonas sp.]MCA1956671.1 MerR family transcriptional regulator [Zymomonas sp.]